MVLCCISTFAWLQIQPMVHARNQGVPPAIEAPDSFSGRITLDNKQHILRMCIKVSLSTSILFAILYFVFLIQEGSIQ
jgi:hypothetical protein